jgi:hypothetical protein
MTRKPKPPTVSISVDQISCKVFSTADVECPLCHQQVPRRVQHECEVNGGVRVVRNRPEDRPKSE